MIYKPAQLDKGYAYKLIIESAVGEDLLGSLEASKIVTVALIDNINENKGSYKYAADKWTIKQVLKHISDSERVHSYRALTIARNDKTELPPFDEDFYALSDNTEELSLLEIKKEFVAVRNSTISLFRTLNKKVLDYEGIGNNLVFTPRIIGWVISGHNFHHCNVIEDKYLKNA